MQRRTHRHHGIVRAGIRWSFIGAANGRHADKHEGHQDNARENKAHIVDEAFSMQLDDAGYPHALSFSEFGRVAKSGVTLPAKSFREQPARPRHFLFHKKSLEGAEHAEAMETSCNGASGEAPALAQSQNNTPTDDARSEQVRQA